LFATQYSTSGTQIAWNQTYSGTQTHGLQPNTIVTPTVVSGATFASGTYGVIVAANMSSGGYRAQNFFYDSLNDTSIHISGSNTHWRFWIKCIVINAPDNQWFINIMNC